MRIVFDIDGVICTNTWGKYEEAQPIQDRIDVINDLYFNGHEIILFTARGSETGIDHRVLTELQMKRWGVKYHDLKFGKPSADLYVDDRAFNSETGDIRRLKEL